MLRCCSKCLKYHDHKFDCKKRVATRNVTIEQEKLNRFYRSYQWQKLKNLKRKDELYACEICRALGKIGFAEHIHHINKVSTNWNLRLDYENLLAVCYMCHKDVEDRGFTTREEIIEYYSSLKQE